LDDSDKDALRVRDLIGQGFATFEMTYNSEHDDFHPHLNVVSDAAFIPWPYLVAVWRIATQGQGEIVYVHRIKNIPEDMQEIVKYVTKSWEIPEARRDDFRKALKGKRRVWPLGGATPAEVKHSCPICGGDDCKAHLAGIGDILERGTTSWGKMIKVRFGHADEVMESWFINRDGLWVEPPPESLNLILRELALHSGGVSPPGGGFQPPLLDGDTLGCQIGSSTMARQGA
jgi:hypothetical protein